MPLYSLQHAGNYDRSAFYFECVEIVRILLLVSVPKAIRNTLLAVTDIGNGDASVIVSMYQSIFSFLFFCLFVLVQPFKTADTNMISVAISVAVYLNYLIISVVSIEDDNLPTISVRDAKDCVLGLQIALIFFVCSRCVCCAYVNASPYTE